MLNIATYSQGGTNERDLMANEGVKVARLRDGLDRGGGRYGRRSGQGG